MIVDPQGPAAAAYIDKTHYLLGTNATSHRGTRRLSSSGSPPRWIMGDASALLRYSVQRRYKTERTITIECLVLVHQLRLFLSLTASALHRTAFTAAEVSLNLVSSKPKFCPGGAIILTALNSICWTSISASILK